ncbi:MAG: hypothetical protein WBG41_17325, partial [Acidimicrobiales bacterium]
MLVATVLVAIGALTAAVATDVHAHARQRAELMKLRTARQQLATERYDLAATNYATTLATQHHTSLVSSIGSTLGQLATADIALAGTNAYASMQGSAITTLQACLGGVANAYQQIRGS